MTRAASVEALRRFLAADPSIGHLMTTPVASRLYSRGLRAPKPKGPRK